MRRRPSRAAERGAFTFGNKPPGRRNCGRTMPLAALAVLLSGLVVVSSAGAEVLGRRQIGIGIGLTRVGDVSIDGTSLDFGARLRLPVGKNFDVGAFHRQAMLEGNDYQAAGAPHVKSKSSEYGVGLDCHVLPGRTADPFISVGISNAMTDTIVDGRPTYADEHLQLRFGGGAELNVQKNISLIFVVAYLSSFDDAYDTDVSAGISLNGWLNDLLLVGVIAEGSFDTGDTSASVRVAYGF